MIRKKCAPGCSCGRHFPRKRGATSTCEVDGCDLSYYARGFCHSHYEQDRVGHPIQKLKYFRRPAGSVRLRDDQGRKQCIACKQWLDESCFHHNGKSLDGLHWRCKRCRRAEITLARYGVSVPEDVRCAICQEDLGDAWVVDHDNSCCLLSTWGKTCGHCYRGILCDPCNRGLGAFRDDEERLRGAIKYLERWRSDRGVILGPPP